MKKEIVGVFVCMLLITTVLPVSGPLVLEKSSIPISYGGDTLYVGGSGPSNHSKIQDAIDYANPGDTVFVLDDSSPYYENVVVNKSINLYGENKDTTIIDGMKKSYVIHVQADDVHIRGFTIKNGTKDLPNAPSGIYCYNLEGSSYDNLHIEHNIITENPNGINLLRSHNSNISNNIIKSSGTNGLHIWLSDNFTCQYNDITDNGDNAIFSLKITNSDISYNMITGNYRPLKIGSKSNNTLISNNIFIGNGNARSGLWLWQSSNFTIRNNIFDNSLNYEIELILNCYNNLIYHNDVYGFPYDDDGASTWDDGYPSGGNYWIDYTGKDADGDGIGDTPYYFPVGQKDRYPLMEPYNDNWIPYARFSYLEDKYNVSFDASSSYDPRGSIVKYEWDFGDGETGEGKIISHDYNKSGKYDVTLKVTDNDGLSDNYSWEVLLFPIPDLSCEGNLIWDDVKPGETIDGSFTVKNIGYLGSLLDWKIESYPEWGTWAFIPMNGTGLTPEDGPVTVNVSVVAPDEQNQQFIGEIKMVNTEKISDFCTIDAVLSTVFVPEVEIKGGYGVNVIIKNNGENDATGVNWEISVEGGILRFINTTVNGTADVKAGSKQKVSSGLLFGLGGIKITVNAKMEKKIVNGKQIIIWTIVSK